MKKARLKSPTNAFHGAYLPSGEYNDVPGSNGRQLGVEIGELLQRDERIHLFQLLGPRTLWENTKRRITDDKGKVQTAVWVLVGK